MKHDIIVWAISDVAEDLILSAQAASAGKKRSARTLRIALIAAAAVILLAGTALAATYKLWSPGLASHFGAGEEAQETLLDSGMTSLIYGEPVTLDNGLKLEVQQVLCDGRSITLSVCYTAPEAGWFTDENRMWGTIYTVSELTVGETAFENDSGGFDPRTVTETTAYMTWTFRGDCSELDGQTAVLRVSPPNNMEEWRETLKETNPDQAESVNNDPLILPAPVELSWTLDMDTAITRELDGTFSGDHGGQTATIEDVTLTPVSIHFILSEGQALIGDLYPVSIVLADGTRIALASGWMEDAASESAGQGAMVGYYTFGTTLLDLDSVAGLAFSSDTQTDPVLTIPLR